MNVFFNRAITKPVDTDVVWERQNGHTRRNLKIISKIEIPERSTMIDGCSLGYLDKGNHSFIFINKATKEDQRTLGVFICADYGYRLVCGDEIFASTSTGGPGNSASKFGIYALNSVVAEASYRNRSGENFYRLTEYGWKFLGVDAYTEEEISYV